MIKDQIIDEPGLRDQCSEIINRLYKSNIVLREFRRKLLAFAEDDSLQGLSYETAKQKMQDYAYITNIVSAVNQKIIIDCTKVVSVTGNEYLDGNKILKKIELLEKKIADLKDKKSETYTKLETLGEYNPMRIIYNWQIDFCTASIASDEKLLKKWKDKEGQMMYVMFQTGDLFQNVEELRNAINVAYQQITVNYSLGDNFVGPRNDSWKDKLRNDTIDNFFLSYNMSNKLDYKQSFTILNREKGKEIDGSHGGHKVWFKDYSLGNEAGKIIDGDELCALMNFYYAVHPGEDEACKITKAEYIAKAEEFLAENKAFKKHMQKGLSDIEPDNGIKKDLQYYLDKIAKEAGYSWAKWETSRKIPLEMIQKQLLGNTPVLLSIGNGSEKWPHLDVYKTSEEHSYYFELERASSVDLADTTVMIKAAEPHCNEETGEYTMLLKVLYNGEDYYIKFNDLCDYKESYLNELTEDQAKESCKNGYNNISIVSY